MEYIYTAAYLLTQFRLQTLFKSCALPGNQTYKPAVTSPGFYSLCCIA
uniref:Uncharacterized protein n=1 Tax=Anguilla anguilla TaxID=7936 RepID=A0A0E9S7Y9_ANGAN